MKKFYDVLTNEELKKIHEASLQVLEETGLLIEHPLACEMLAANGAKIDSKLGRVYFPADLIEKLIKKTPESFFCAARDPQFDLNLHYKQEIPFFRVVAGPITYCDLVKRQSRSLALKDIEDMAHISDSLKHIDIVSAMTPMDVPSQFFDIVVVKSLLEKNRKHFWAMVSSSKNLKVELEMMSLVAGSKEALKERPLASGIFCVIDPLRIPDDEVERLILYGEHGIPIRITIASVVGGNAPFTLAGSLVQINAEFLAASALAQLMCPGLAVSYYPLIQILDMKNGISVGDGPEILLIYAACAQLARHYKVPANLTHMGLASAQAQQLMYHLGAYQFFGTFLGASEQGGAGSLFDAMGYSHQALIMANESMEYAKHFHKGLNINTETLAVADIKEMALKGEYFSSKLTMKYLRQENRFKGNLWERGHFTNNNKDYESFLVRADNLAKKLLKEKSEIPPLEKNVQQELNKIFKKATKQ